MRHRVYGKHLGRDKDERRNLFKGLVQSLFTYGTIQTSEAKAKAIKPLVDKVINLAKDKARIHLLAGYLVNQDLQDRLVSEIIPKLDGRTSGYTSLVRLRTRFGDQTTMVKMSLVGAEQLKPLDKGIGYRVQGTGKKIEDTKKAVLEKKLTPKKTVVGKRKATKK